MANCKTLKVKDLRKMLDLFVKEGFATENSEIWLSSDEEGNSYSPLIQMGERFNVGTEEDKSKVTFYPSSAHTDW